MADAPYGSSAPAFGRSFDDVRRALQKNLRAVRNRVLDEQDAFAVVAGAVRQAHDWIKASADVPNKWPAVGEALEDVYRRAGDAHAEADRMEELLGTTTTWPCCGRC
jgi:hypothetical protein